MYVIVRTSRAGRLYFCGDPPDKPGRTLPMAGWTPDQQHARVYATFDEVARDVRRLRESELTLEAHGHTIEVVTAPTEDESEDSR
jgi:hypothetical protein